MINQKSLKRPADDQPYVVQVAAYCRSDGRWVKAYLRRLPLKKVA